MLYINTTTVENQAYQMNMSKTTDLQIPGFVLESADSVRFGTEYTDDEQERNRQMLFGELLCGLLMGEKFWTNAVFAFDSRGAIEVLAAIARESMRGRRADEFLPFCISVYPSDKDTWEGKPRNWVNPGELYLRCYAHRLNNQDFKLSATPKLDVDCPRRKNLAAEIRDLAGSGRDRGINDIQTNCDKNELEHLGNIFDIDRYILSWLGSQRNADFNRYLNLTNVNDLPIRQNRGNWWQDYLDGQEVGKLYYFLHKADEIVNHPTVSFDVPDDCLSVLQDALKLDPKNLAFSNRSNFRTWLIGRGIQVRSPVYRVLTELMDGHYVRTQQSVLTHAQREVTSPASQSSESQIGEKWASAAMRKCRKDQDGNASWQFINEIKAASSTNPLRIDLDKIARYFKSYTDDPNRMSELRQFHSLLHDARKHQINHGPPRSPGGSSPIRHLYDIANDCCNKINKYLGASCNVNFYFNTTDPSTGSGSLTFVYLGNKATSQCTGNPQPVGVDQSEGASHTIH